MIEFSFDSSLNEDDAALLSHLGNISTMTFPDDATAIQTYLSFIMHMLHMRTAYISELKDGMARVQFVMDTDGCGLPVETVAPLQESFCQYVRASSAPVLIHDAANDPRVVDVAMRRDFNVGSYLGVPLVLSNGSLYGSLCVMDPDIHIFTAAHVAVLRTVARHLAALIERTTTRPIFQTAYQDAATDVSATLMTLDVQTMIMQAVAHDVRNPLMNIYSYVELLIDGTLGQLTVAQQEALKSILRASQFISRLTADLAEFNQVHQRTFTLITGQIDPVALAHNVIAAYRPQATKQELQLFIEQRTTMPLLGDAERIQQVLRNLLSNALRYTPAGWVRLVIDAYDKGVEFRVEDSGIGIPDEIQAHIWERFTRGTSIGDGTGLGLYVVHELVRAMNGTVGVRSTVGEGSCFWVRLPAYGLRPQQVAWR